MTKFPDNVNPQPADVALTKVITTVKDAITAAGFKPRIATPGETTYHPLLWDNVEMYLFGCRRAVAIIENKYKNELNPNVTMEWGWMRGMDKDVLYLVENEFSLVRADITGLIERRFPWDNPEADIQRHVREWLQPL
jgi:hypothetical protein